MQWVFLVLALVSALVELQTGTFYLAAVAAVALVTYLLGFRVDAEILIFVFIGGCLVAAALVWFWHRRTSGRHAASGGSGLSDPNALGDFDAGQPVIVAAATPGERLVVTYRGTRWDAVLDDLQDPEPVPAIGGVLWIRRKQGSVLHLARHPPVQEASR